MPAFRTMNPFEFSLYFYETEIEYLKKHIGVTFTEEEIDASFEKGDPKLLLDEINRRQKVSHRGKDRRSSGKTGEKGHHPSVKIIPATK